MSASYLQGSYVFSLFVILLLFSQCSHRISDNIPTVRYQNLRIEQIQPELERANLKLKLGMRFQFKNPLNQDLLIPEHDLTFRLNDRKVSGDINQQAAFTLPGKSEKQITYYFTFDLNPQGILQDLDVLGKDNYFELNSEFKLNLADHGINLPAALSTYTFEVAYGDTIRLPLLPEIRTADQAGRVELLGQMETLDLRPFKNAAQPFVSLLNQSFNVQDPFIKLMLETKLPVYTPEPGNPFKTSQVNLADHVVNTLLQPIDPQAMVKWSGLKGKLAPDSPQPVMDQIMQTFLKPINPAAPQQWNAFKIQWSSFVDNIPEALEYPGPRVTGILVEIPFLIHNPNQFIIEAPAFFASTELPAFQPVSLSADPLGGTAIGAGQDHLMLLRMQLRWGDDENPGLDWLVQGDLLQLTLRGSTRLDLGYGPVNVYMEVPLNLQLGN
jgi:hypothetical protein